MSRTVELVRRNSTDLGLVFAAALFLALLATYSTFIVDDAYIVARYAENLVDGGALVFNRGEPVSALTSPAQALLEAGLYRLTQSTIASYKLVALVALLGTVAVLVALYRQQKLILLVVMTVFPLSPCVVIWTFGGLETPLLLAGATSMTLLVTCSPSGPFSWRRLALLAFLGGVAFLTRFDSVLFVAPILLYGVLRARRLWQAFGALMVAAAGPILWLVLAGHYYGDILPTSYYVKPPSTELHTLSLNAVYILEYLTLVGLMPFALLLGCAWRWQRGWRVALKPISKIWPVVLGIGLMLGYGLTIARIHMMFSFRFFVPYLPSAAVVLGSLVQPALDAANGAYLNFRIERWLLAGAAAMLVFQTGLAAISYRWSLNPVVGIPVEMHVVSMAASSPLLKIAADGAGVIRAHWNLQPRALERPPRIATYAAGILPYEYRSAYIFEPLISYRRDCSYNWRVSADYVNILAPLLGSLAQQLPKPVEHYELILSSPLTFEDQPGNYMVFFDPTPDPNHLPPRTTGPCL